MTRNKRNKWLFVQNKLPIKRMNLPRCHWVRLKNRWKPKKQYQTEDAAFEVLNQSPRLLAQGYTAYQCQECGKWHIGRKEVGNGTEED